MGAFVTADPDTRVIEITKVPVSGLSSLDVQVDIYSDLKEDWLATPALQNVKFPLRSFGDPKTPEQAIGPYVFLDNASGWRIQPHDSDHELTVNGNIVPEDVTKPVWLPRIARQILILEEQSAQALTTVKELVDIQFASFNGGVTVDVTTSNTGTTFPVGTARAPVNNIPDAVAIALANGLPSRMFIIGNYTFTTGDNLDGWEIEGENPGQSTFTVQAGATVQNCEFRTCFLTGTLDGNNTVVDSQIDDLSFVDGHIERCLITGTISLSGVSDLHMLDCWSGVIGTGTPIIDLGGSGSGLALRNWNGGIELRNKTGTDSVSADLNSGHLILAATVTAGTIVVRGVGELTDNSVGATLDVELLEAAQLDRIERMTNLIPAAI